MQVLCDLQGIFLLFNCQTPVISTEKQLMIWAINTMKITP